MEYFGKTVCATYDELTSGNDPVIKPGTLKSLQYRKRVDVITHDFSKKNKFSIIIPIFFSNPAFKVGIPVLRIIFCFTCAIPNALFHEKEKPRIPVFVFLQIGRAHV